MAKSNGKFLAWSSLSGSIVGGGRARPRKADVDRSAGGCSNPGPTTLTTYWQYSLLMAWRYETSQVCLIPSCNFKMSFIAKQFLTFESKDIVRALMEWWLAFETIILCFIDLLIWFAPHHIAVISTSEPPSISQPPSTRSEPERGSTSVSAWTTSTSALYNEASLGKGMLALGKGLNPRWIHVNPSSAHYVTMGLPSGYDMLRLK